MTPQAPVPFSLQQLFPGFVATECCRIADAVASLDPAEQSAVAHAVDKRQQEFSAGRMCARQALGRLGIASGPLRKLPDRSIAWPDNVIGTVSHNETWCGAAVVLRTDAAGIGLDIETIARVGENLWRRILTDEERNRLDREPSAEVRQQQAALIFSAKEALYKCIAAHVKRRIGFMDASIAPDLQQGSFAVSLRAPVAAHLPRDMRLQGRFFFSVGTVFAGIVLF